MDPKLKNDDAGSSDMPKKCHKELSLSEKVNVLDLIRKEKKFYAEVAKSYSKNETSTCEIMKKEKEIYATSAVAPQTANVMATVCAQCRVIRWRRH